MIRLIFMTDFTEQYASSLLRGILRFSHETEPWCICKMPPEYKRVNGIKGVVEWALNWQADAIIGQFEPEDDISLFQKAGIIVIAQDYKQRFKSVTNITCDYRQAGRKAAEFYILKGFRNFAFYGYDHVVWSDERYEGFRDYLTENGYGNNLMAYRKQSLEEYWHYKSDALAEWLMTLPHSTALFAADDTMACKIVEQSHVIKLNIPLDICVLGVDNDEIVCQLTYPELSSIMMDVERAGYETAKAICHMKSNRIQRTDDIFVHYIGIMERSSTDILVAKNPYIQKALYYIHTHISHKMSVKDILRQVPMSRRLFEQKFRAETNTTPHNYITTLRMDRLAKLLLSSDESIEALAMMVGIEESKNLSRQFKARKGMTPLEFRKKYK